MDDIMKKLQEPFDPLEIEWRVGVANAEKTKGLALAYVTNRAIQNRLDDVFGCFGWKNEFKEWRGNSQLCGISIKFGEEWITKWDGADDSNMEATKGGLSDAMKRAAYQWGIGRYLYNLPDVWMPLEMKGKTPVIKGIPTLPKWALPASAAPTTPHTTKPAEKPTEPPTARQERTTLSDDQLSQFGQLCRTEADKTKLKLYVKDMGCERLSEVQSVDFETLMFKFTGTELPFNV